MELCPRAGHQGRPASFVVLHSRGIRLRQVIDASGGRILFDGEDIGAIPARPDLVILDEPTAGVVLNLLQQLKQTLAMSYLSSRAT